MSTTETLAAFDTAELQRSITERDAEALLRLYAEDAELRIVDAANPPSQPQVVRGRDDIGAFLADLCGRDMTHRVLRLVAERDHTAYLKECTNPDGSRVRYAAVLDHPGGRITTELAVQAFD